MGDDKLEENRSRGSSPFAPRRRRERALLEDYYRHLIDYFGPQGWWPGQSPFEVIVGAILAQNTSWKNVERALTKLRDAHLLTPEKLSEVEDDRLYSYIRPAGYFRLKTRRLLSFMEYFRDEYLLDIDRLRKRGTVELRNELLGVWGIGPETADAILLYALDKPVFVVDAYTRRILSRHRLVDEKATYQEIQRLFMSSLPKKASFFNEYHALLVSAGKNFCRKEPRCESCPLEPFLDVRYH